ncbi:uncharacterized protein LOC62_02G002478 [Vanrija pseudolonga]|uniref:Shugoshin C-terminal domain-containing protein n=1 Tax=Vanrija pseudolonga TaxID=143232 RepID=A0AAF0Y6D5_9TREE|nr:hypothetical protein LOC62_02G002478 [Vanrija pseudolonga]
MSQRRSRRSFGPPDTSEGGSGAGDATTTQLQQFDDFRRRHSRQNREIISENITRKGSMNNLQGQIAELKVELLEVQQANRFLRKQVQKAHKESMLLKSQETRDALDAVLAAVPALLQLRAALNKLPAPQPVAGPSSLPYKHDFGNPTATRPAATAAEYHELEILAEASETETPPRSQGRRKSRGRPSPSKNGTYGSPSPKVDRRQVYLDPSSPVTSPSPKRSTPKKDRQRRRRESGLLPQPPTVSPAEMSPLSEPPSESPLWEAQSRLEEQAVEQAVTPTSKRRDTSSHIAASKGKNLTADLAAIGKERVPLGERTRAGNTPAADLGKPLPKMPSTKSARGSTPPPPPPARERASSTPPPTSPSADEDGGRMRRVRKSVNYKEPSLKDKMRNELNSGVRRKSTLPRSSAKMSGLGKVVLDDSDLLGLPGQPQPTN